MALAPIPSAYRITLGSMAVYSSAIDKLSHELGMTRWPIDRWRR